jgi:hypothetical protein
MLQRFILNDVSFHISILGIMFFNVIFYSYFCIQIQQFFFYPIDLETSGGLFVGLKPYQGIACVFGFVLAVFSSFGITLSSKLHQIVHMHACDGYQPIF